MPHLPRKRLAMVDNAKNLQHPLKQRRDLKKKGRTGYALASLNGNRGGGGGLNPLTFSERGNEKESSEKGVV